MPIAPSIITRSLPGLPRRTLSPAEQMEALRRVQAQADQRVKLGTQIFKAVEAQTTQHQATLDQIRAEQAKLHEEIQADAARSLQGFEDKVAQIDDQFTQKLKALEDRLDTLAANWKDAEGRIGYMMRRAEVLLDQTRYTPRDATAPAAAARPMAALPPLPPELPAELPPELSASIPAEVPAAAVSIAPPHDDATLPPSPVASADPADDTPPVRYVEIVRQLRERQLDSGQAADHAA